MICQKCRLLEVMCKSCDFLIPLPAVPLWDGRWKTSCHGIVDVLGLLHCEKFHT